MGFLINNKHQPHLTLICNTEVCVLWIWSFLISSLSPADFSIWMREAGAGGLSIAVEGPSRAEISFDDRKDGSCGVSYIAQEPGTQDTHSSAWCLFTDVSLWVTFSPPPLQVIMRFRWSLTISTYLTAPTLFPLLLQRTTLGASLLPAFRWGMRRHLHTRPTLPCLRVLGHSCIKMWCQEQRQTFSPKQRRWTGCNGSTGLDFWSNTSYVNSYWDHQVSNCCWLKNPL